MGESAAVDAAPGDAAGAGPAIPGDPETAPTPAPRAPRRRARSDMLTLVVIGLITIALIVFGGLSIYRSFYSPSAFVERYLSLLSQGRAADALLLPGVLPDAAGRESAGLPPQASDALLRRAALASLSNVRRVSETATADGVDVTVSYRSGGVAGTSTFRVAQRGWDGPLPEWGFAAPPLSTLGVAASGSTTFDVNGFELDKRQVSADGTATGDISLLVFSPGLYKVGIDTQIASAGGLQVLADVPGKNVPVDIAASATPEFTQAVDAKVHEFLDACATQQVLQPTGCPFGLQVRNRVIDTPKWSITRYPETTLQARGDDWVVPTTAATAHISVSIRSLYDGSVTKLERDVPFMVQARVEVLGSGSVSILVSGGDRDDTPDD